MQNKHGFVLVAGIFMELIASALIMAAANPESGLQVESRMWYSILGTILAFAGGFAAATAIAYSEIMTPRRLAPRKRNVIPFPEGGNPWKT